MDMHDKKVGIWGFGVVGKSAARYLQPICSKLELLDKRELTDNEKQLARQLNASCYQGNTAQEIEEFLNRNDAVIVSPGVDTRPFASFAHKFVSELDLLHASYKKPIIAITGSVGKTTVTHILGHILQSVNKAWWVGGNIGTGMLDLLSVKDQTCGAILEVSSFQLEHCRTFAPHLAIITNIFPNHIDRHGSFEEYVKAKCAIFSHLGPDDHALLPCCLHSQLDTKIKLHDHLHFFDATGPADNVIGKISQQNLHTFYLDHQSIIDACNDHIQPLIAINQLPDITFTQNWLIICAALRLLNVGVPDLNKAVANLTMPAHRLEKVATINGIDFYNDSKGTTPAATLAAVEKLKNRPTIVLLGGLSKGVDRTQLINQLAGQVKSLVLFGKEHAELAKASHNAKISYQEAITLENALNMAVQMAQPGDQIVLSPAGSSFDQFEHYQARGDYFKECVNVLQKNFKNKYKQTLDF